MIDAHISDDLLKKFNSKLEIIRSLCEENAVSFEIRAQLDELADLLAQRPGEYPWELSAQISIYPLRKKILSETINQALEELNSFELQIIPGSMSTLIVGEEAQLWAGLRSAFSIAAAQGEAVMIATISNACPKPARDDN